jgi:hypothetical protein
VKELLELGTIQHSQRPFSFLILLVRKSDESYRICVNYQALRKETIKDKFHILVVKELLDELYSS